MKIDNLKQIKDVIQDIKEILDKGLSVVIDIKPFSNTRSSHQNRYYWKVCNHLARWLNYHNIPCILDKMEMGWDQDFIHKINKYKLGIESTKRLSIKEFIDYMEQVNILWNTKTDGNYTIPEPASNYLKKAGYAKD